MRHAARASAQVDAEVSMPVTGAFLHCGPQPCARGRFFSGRAVLLQQATAASDTKGRQRPDVELSHAATASIAATAHNGGLLSHN